MKLVTFRMIFGASILGLACDIGVLTATLLKLYSDTATSMRLDLNSDASQKLEQEITFAYVSCALSIMSFSVSAVGFGTVYSGLRQAVRRSSAAMRTSIARIASSGPVKVGLLHQTALLL